MIMGLVALAAGTKREDRIAYKWFLRACRDATRLREINDLKVAECLGDESPKKKEGLCGICPFSRRREG